MNTVQLIGRLVKDVDMKYTPNGVALSTFTLAVNRPFKNKQGDNEADFIRIQVWRKSAENVANYCKKGSQVAVVGRIQTSSFEGKNGQIVYMTEIVADNVQFLDTRHESNGNGNGNARNTTPNPNGNKGYNPYQNQDNGNGQSPGSSQNQSNPYDDPVDVNDEDLPF